MCYTNYILCTVAVLWASQSTLAIWRHRTNAICKINDFEFIPLGHRGPRPALRLLKKTSKIENPLLIDRLAFKLLLNLSFIGSVVGIASPPFSMLFWEFSLVCTARYCPKNFIISRIFTDTCTHFSQNTKYNQIKYFPNDFLQLKNNSHTTLTYDVKKRYYIMVFLEHSKTHNITNIKLQTLYIFRILD